MDPTAGRNAEFAIAIADEFQRQGLGTRLMKLIVAHASRRGVQRLFGQIMVENNTMLEFVRKFGFGIRDNDADPDTMTACISVGAMTTMTESRPRKHSWAPLMTDLQIEASDIEPMGE